MNSHVQRFYRKVGEKDVSGHSYHEVIALHDSPSLSWEDAIKRAPSLPRGWYELSQLKPADRIEFIPKMVQESTLGCVKAPGLRFPQVGPMFQIWTHLMELNRGSFHAAQSRFLNHFRYTLEFWLATLPFFPHVDEFLKLFFGKLDDVGVFLVQLNADSPFECEIAYSLGDDSCFYRGFPPLSSSGKIEQLKVDFNEVLPEDYLAFVRIHDGFGKHTDTGILPTHHLDTIRKQLAEELELAIDPMGLIPFYKSSSKPCYQCFFVEWAPMGQVGNVYCSAEKMVSDINDKNSWAENLAFPTFLDWLIYYLKSFE